MTDPTGASDGGGDLARDEGASERNVARLRQVVRYLRQQEELGAPRLYVQQRWTGLGDVAALAMSGPSAQPHTRSLLKASEPIMAQPPLTGITSVQPTSTGRLSVEANTPRPPQTTHSAVHGLPGTLLELRAHCSGCTKCGLAAERTQTVFSDGNPEARLMVVGEAPGANEDASGLPFVGAAGKLLDLLLATVDLSRDSSVYICNVVKCRPPGNRNPEPEEIEACAPYLKKQIELVQPEAILAVGTFAGRLLSGKDLPLGALRGTTHHYEGIPLIVTYHPAALLRNSGWIRPTWTDMQRVRRILDGVDAHLHLPV
jgi:uracil-DNA glycosylase family 4